MSGMKHLFLTLLAFTICANAAQADCYVDYKAKRDDPLRLHYGVAEIEGVCTKAAASTVLVPRLADGDWQLLNVLDVFDASGLEERKESAGEYFLRY